MPETSTFEIFHSGNTAFINPFDKTKCLFHSPINATPQFLLKLEIHFVWFELVILQWSCVTQTNRVTKFLMLNSCHGLNCVPLRGMNFDAGMA